MNWLIALLLPGLGELPIVQPGNPADVEGCAEEGVEHQGKELHAIFEDKGVEELLEGYDCNADCYYDDFEGRFDVSFPFPYGDPQEGKDHSEHLLVRVD